MRTHHLLLAAAMALSTPVTAQTAPAAPPPLFSQPLPQPDPARAAAAKPVIDALWPIGTYARLMHTTMDQVVQGMMGRMLDMTPDQAAASMGIPADKKSRPDETLGQAAEKEDPAFRERMRITMRVMGDSMAELMTEVEPQVRDALVASYARRFSVAELEDLQRFFVTPTGRAYAADSMLLMMSPDMMNAMQSFLPKMIERMPAMMAQVEQATKHLPPVPKKGVAK